MTRASNLNAANLLTLIRVLLLPVFFMLCFYAYREDPDPSKKLYRVLGVSIYFAIVLTDLADGYVARRRGQVTPLGSLLDPLADKLFIATSFLLMAAFGRLPAWLATIVVSKDLLMLIGWGALYVLSRNAVVRPSKVGKVCSVVQYATIGAILVRLPDAANQWLFWPATGLLTAISFIGYALDALEQTNRRDTV